MSHDPFSNLLILGIPEMDSAHRALFDAIHRVNSLPMEQFREHCRVLFDALETDCREEEAMMERLDYPGIAQHREQHARVLSGLHHAMAALDQDDPAPAQRVLELLPRWLELHISTMDMALAAYAAAEQALGEDNNCSEAPYS